MSILLLLNGVFSYPCGNCKKLKFVVKICSVEVGRPISLCSVRLKVGGLSRCTSLKYAHRVVNWNEELVFENVTEKNLAHVSLYLLDYKRVFAFTFIDLNVLHSEKSFTLYEGKHAHIISLHPIKIVCLDKAARYFEKKYKLIQHLHFLEQQGIQTLVFEEPHCKKVENPSEWEKLLSRKKKFIAGPKYLEEYDRYLQRVGINKEYYDFYANIHLHELGFIRQRDYLVCVDVRSKYVNIINHIRPAVGLPNKVLNNIHIIGDSTAWGTHIIDEDTSASYLQRNINDIRRNDKGSYACLIYGQSNGTVNSFQHHLDDLIVKKRDIIVIVGVSGLFGSQTFAESCKANGIPYYDLQPYFNRPHELGNTELFFDKCHPNKFGNKLIGDILFDKIFVGPLKIHIPLKYKHYFCETVNPLVVTDIKWKLKMTEDEISKNLDFMSFVQNLEKYHNSLQITGAVVMNCNPFTKGHLYLVETAADRVDRLFVLVVEEDKSDFPFDDRLRLVKFGTTHLQNVVVLPSGKFVISTITLPEYFMKEQNPNAHLDASNDLNIFCKWIGPSLGVGVRFVGEEPLDQISLQYNRAMSDTLPRCGIRIETVPRKEIGGIPISASRVRVLLKSDNLEEISLLVPTTTFDYLLEKWSFQRRKKKSSLH